jgi:hypothetical protein
MDIISHSPVANHFFSPSLDLLPSCSHLRSCPELSDANWLLLGVARCLQPNASGRHFLQVLASLNPELDPGNSLFFETLKSQRRLNLCTELNTKLCVVGPERLPDALATFACLERFDIYAGDGHFHEHAVHDPADEEGKKHAVGHFYTRNLRSGLVSHLCVGDQIHRKKEHDMRALKRLSIAQLRQGAPKGRKVLYVWDRAGIDFKQWYDWKQGSGIYVLSRCKENMDLTKCEDLPYDQSDPINAGILGDEVVTGGGFTMRRITYHDPESGRTFQYLTNVIDSDVLPGVLAFLYKIRWNLEKSFDEFKNKLGEQKAWATTPTAKSMQAQFLCLTLNLLHLLDHDLEKNEGIHNKPEKERRAKRLEKAKASAAKAGLILPKTVELVQNLTQHSVKLIRWVATQLWLSNPWAEACVALAALYRYL